MSKQEDWAALAEAMNKLTGDIPPLDFEPESVATARARFPKALREHFDPMNAALGRVVPPSKTRKNVFDFDEGIRIIVSVDNLQTKVVLHFSGSFTEDGANTLMDRALKTGRPMQEIKEHVATQARSIIERKIDSFAPGLKLKLIMVTPIGAFHFLAEESDMIVNGCGIAWDSHCESDRRRVMKETVSAECDSCNATGIYRGFAEPKGVGVVCLSCGGSGCTEITYTPFVRRHPRQDVETVQLSRGGKSISYRDFLAF